MAKPRDLVFICFDVQPTLQDPDRRRQPRIVRCCHDTGFTAAAAAAAAAHYCLFYVAPDVVGWFCIVHVMYNDGCSV